MLNVEFCGINFNNPVVAASGTFGFAKEYEEFTDLNRLGGISSKGLTIFPKDGNSGLRIHETPAGIMNSIGLQNPSVQEFINNGLDYMLGLDAVAIANIGGADIKSYIEAVELISTTDIELIELNISCPNVKEGGMAFGISCPIAENVVKEVRKHTDKKLMVKLSPNAENIVDMAKACEQAGADALSLVNTFNAMAVDVKRKKPVFDNITAGLSGPCIKPIAVRMAYEVCKAVSIPVCGMGGIMNYEDALEFLMVGCKLVQVGTANFTNPNIMVEIIDGLENYVKENKLKSINDIIGII
ncbi:MAG: dihydroorotate dehydrogenase [Finegoldia sp.]|nr:dihydroorotate dehydrogenase [Finegoldia sp.]